MNNTFVLSALNMGSERAASQLIICRHKHGRIELKGDLKKREALKALEKIIIEEDAMTMKWVPNKELPKLEMPLALVMKNPNKVKTMATNIFNVFLKENGAKFGIGKFEMWHYKIAKALLVETAPLLSNLPETFSLDDIISWENLRGHSISNGPPATCLKSSCGVKTWLAVVKIMLEVCLVVKNVDPNVPTAPPVQHSSHRPLQPSSQSSAAGPSRSASTASRLIFVIFLIVTHEITISSVTSFLSSQ